MKTVERGAALLDERVPGWEERIDVEALDLSTNCKCVLGQLYLAEHPRLRERYEAYERELGALELRFEEAPRFGFMVWGSSSYENLTSAWRRLICKRRAA